jgi:CheY-like chemotaxis protein
VGKVLLVVDDSQTIRAAIEMVFRGTEYEVVARASGTSGLEWIGTGSPDLILVDEKMPDMDGYEFGNRVKSNGRHSDIPILLLACQDGPDESRADDAALDGYVNKPFGSQELVTLVEMLTGASLSSAMPPSFKEQLSHRHRDRQPKPEPESERSPIEARDDGASDEQLAFEAELMAATRDERTPQRETPRASKTADLRPTPPPPPAPAKIERPVHEAASELAIEAPKPTPKPVEPPPAEPRSTESPRFAPAFAREALPPSPLREPPPPSLPSFGAMMPPFEARPPPPPPEPPQPMSADAAGDDFEEEAPPPPEPPPPPAEPSPDLDVAIEAPVEAGEAHDPADDPQPAPPPSEIDVSPTMPPSDEPEEPAGSGSRAITIALVALAIAGALVAFLFVNR